MTRKKINNLSMEDALKIYLKAGCKVTFDTKDEDIKAKAREILRNEKKSKTLL